MEAIRRHVVPERDGEIILRDVPVTKDQEVQVILLTERLSPECQQTLAVIRSDPAWAFLRDPAEDIYTEDDVKEKSCFISACTRTTGGR
jgi:hypothetical protein